MIQNFVQQFHGIKDYTFVMIYACGSILMIISSGCHWCECVVDIILDLFT